MIQVLFFGRIADVLAQRKLTLDVRESGLSLFAVRERLFADLIADGRVSPQTLKMSVNQVVVSEDQRLKAGDEVAFFSLFSGG